MLSLVALETANDSLFAVYPKPGLRCPYGQEEIASGRVNQQEIIMPWLAGFHVNDVYGAVCDAWPVKPIHATTKKPFYSNVPVLLGAGGLDDACRPLYNDILHHYFPNSQRLLFTKRLHGPLLNSFEGDVYIGNFLDKPFERLNGQKDIEAY